MLLCVRERSINENHNHSSLQRQFSNGHSPKFEAGATAAASGTRVSHFLPTSRRIVQFSNGRVCSCKIFSLMSNCSYACYQLPYFPLLILHPLGPVWYTGDTVGKREEEKSYIILFVWHASKALKFLEKYMGPHIQ